MKLGIDKQKAYEWGNTRKGYWGIAKSIILSCTVTDERLRIAGYVFFSDYYEAVRVKYEGTAVYGNRTYGGGGGRKTKVGEKLLRFPPTRC